MDLSLKSPAAKAGFLATCFLLAALLELVSLRQYLAYRQYAKLTIGGLEDAIRFDPGNAEYPGLLGRMYLYQEQDFSAARSAINRALSLNPHNARYWLDLANIDEVTGNSLAEQGDLQSALQAEPTMPEVSWEVGNLYLLRGDQPDAFRNFAVVEKYSPSLRLQALELSLRVQPDITLLLPAVPRSVDSLSQLLQILYEQRRFSDAAAVWRSLVSLHQPINADYVRSYLAMLLSANDSQAAQAQKVWSDFLALNPEMADYVTSGNAVVNGGFERDVLGWGFDWQYDKRPHVSLSQESGVFHEGSRSLSVSFDGNDIQDFGIFQYVAVKPNTRYALQAFVKAENIVGSSGPRLAVASPYNFSQRFYASDDILGSTLWSAQGGTFTTGPTTHLVAIGLLRNQPYDPIKGHLWLDDVSLTEEGSE